ncbi:hypothetical protein [Cytobacillus oceanisediminis]|uniref:hypothetical protein n=1 Tax=Cytobacillus oceanisediminis TaxID=665099 RepID=UPI001FB51D88|nr:hypothetical protein [Cytobacillus oceanisediminis]UOE55164.1 hypothetical protein IRB79_25925 [Cytobacillus oceanisediminis]
MSILKKLAEYKIINSLLSLGSASLISAIFTFLVGVATRNILGPEQYGYYLTISIAFTFIPMMQLGTLNGMNREVPFYLARKEFQRVKEVRNLTFSFLFTLPLLFVLFLVIFSVTLFSLNLDIEYKTGISLTALISILLFIWLC